MRGHSKYGPEPNSKTFDDDGQLREQFSCRFLAADLAHIRRHYAKGKALGPVIANLIHEIVRDDKGAHNAGAR